LQAKFGENLLGFICGPSGLYHLNDRYPGAEPTFDKVFSSHVVDIHQSGVD
jgi:hypothetical protein